jgi:hypothetical protein
MFLGSTPALAGGVDAEISAVMINGQGAVSADVDLAGVTFTPCVSGEPVWVPVGEWVDLVAGMTVEVAADQYCDAEMEFDSRITLVVNANSSGTITKILELDVLALERGNATLDDPSNHEPVVARVVVADNPKLEGLLPTEGVAEE